MLQCPMSSGPTMFIPVRVGAILCNHASKIKLGDNLKSATGSLLSSRNWGDTLEELERDLTPTLHQFDHYFQPTYLLILDIIK